MSGHSLTQSLRQAKAASARFYKASSKTVRSNNFLPAAFANAFPRNSGARKAWWTWGSFNHSEVSEYLTSQVKRFWHLITPSALPKQKLRMGVLV